MKKQNKGRRASRGEYSREGSSPGKGQSGRKKSFQKAESTFEKRQGAKSAGKKSERFSGRKRDSGEKQEYIYAGSRRGRSDDEKFAGKRRFDERREQDTKVSGSGRGRSDDERNSGRRRDRGENQDTKYSVSGGRSDDDRYSGRRRDRGENLDTKYSGSKRPGKETERYSRMPKGDERTFTKKYRDADKSEAGWTKPDGRPMRKRIPEEGKSKQYGRKSSEEQSRPPKNRSYERSSSADRKPFERFEKNPSRKQGRREQYSTPREQGNEKIRLNRFLSNAGICSRREADELIEAGLVSVNGKIVTELGTKVSKSDDVRYNGERLKAEKNVYLLLNKPKDYITTADDPGGRKTVMELVDRACKERIYPVGRLDRNTTGLLLFTNDGDLAKQLTHPSSNIRKIYHVELDKNLKRNDLQQLLDGIELEDGLATVDDISYDAGGDKSQIGLELHSGKNRIVRRMFESLGYEVRKLDRVMFAGLTKKDLPRGRWRMLTDVEIASLKMQTGKSAKRQGKDPKEQLKLF